MLYIYKNKKGLYFVADDYHNSYWISVDKIKTKNLEKEYGLSIVPKGAHEYNSSNVTKVCKWADRDTQLEKKGIIMDKLYEFEHEGKTLYGTHLATNGQGLWVMDVKGSAPVAIKKEDATEVIPHAIKVGIDGQVTTMLADKDKYAVGEAYFNASGKVAVIKAVDVKERTTHEFKPVAQILTKPV